MSNITAIPNRRNIVHYQLSFCNRRSGVVRHIVNYADEPPHESNMAFLGAGALDRAPSPPNIRRKFSQISCSRAFDAPWPHSPKDTLAGAISGGRSPSANAA
eukprot:8114387-Pyramimonas_sp.AAC.1